MKLNDLLRDIKLLDIVVLWLDERDFSDSEIATMCDISQQTIHNTKNRLKPFTDALKAVKTTPGEYGNHDINTIINSFMQAFGTTKSTKYDRFAANRLIKKYPAEVIVGAINALSQCQNDKYAPSVRSISQFEEKLPNIARYLKTKSDDKIINL